MKNSHTGFQRHMKRLCRLAALGVATSCALTAPAVEVSSEVGVEWVSFHYREPGLALMREDGSMLGLFAAYTWDFEKMKLRVATSYDWGAINYDGWLMNFQTGETISSVRMDTPNNVFNLRVAGGPKFKTNTAGLTITPMVGVGFRYLLNDLPGFGGYTREQTYWYIPIGIEAAREFGKGWTCTVRAEYDYFLSGNNISGGDAFTQDSGYGFHLSAGVSHPMKGKKAESILVEPYFRYWNIDDSSVTLDGWLEPANDCSEYGIKCSVTF